MIVPTLAHNTSYNSSRYFLHYLTIWPTLAHDVSTVSHDITYTSSRQYLQQTTKVTILAHYCTYTSSRYFIQQLTILPTVSYDITFTSSRYFYSISCYNLHYLTIVPTLDYRFGRDCSLTQTCTPNGHLYTVKYTRCRIDTINSPDDGHMAAWNM